jgi:hypothetical protein
VTDADRRTVRFTDGSTPDAGIVIWATGSRPDYSWIHIPGVTRDGQVIHRRGVTDVPGLYFLGLSWQHTRGSAANSCSPSPQMAGRLELNPAGRLGLEPPVRRQLNGQPADRSAY